ncbi:ATP-grasp ribosomal peptide maturase [Plantactinospora sp. S1510]|uniref:ATP-grasp ribosomal peptide maturase n=1 Tax=Plantactinospora alkalitolerans TaxID=2789879 RepID=A0ABS0H9R9_9ACTN|nr:ATP-grasp ribosomal peptide maturase [Plantactinospora alkalitolerans]MBF9135223.1 ATP-grasp ribosomal peptide maturase [Plantactinospora alkalitolerans]
MTVLVITEPCDVTVDLVIQELNDRHVPVHRIDLADFPQALSVVAAVGDHGQWAGTLADDHRCTRLEEVRAVYFRRPEPARLPGALDPYERRWAAREAELGFGGLLAALPHARWVNDPRANAAADRKPRQLAVATGHGMTVPQTLVTNDPEEARRFVAAATGGAIYKPFHMRPYVDADTDQLMALATTPVTAGDITDAVAGTAHLFQHQVPKAYELRVTAVGDRLFAARIDAHSEAAKIDWRTDYANLAYAAVDLPKQVSKQLHAIRTSLRLTYAAFDLIVTPDGDYVFLEVNPDGQWAWIEHETGLPIAAALADTLEKT